MSLVRILAFAGSIRTGAYSGKLAAAAAKELALNDADVTLISLLDYPLPLYDSALHENKGIPENARLLARQIAAHQGVFIATPEYNHAPPPLLINTITWISRIKHDEIAYRQRVYGLGSTAPGKYGGARALTDLDKIVSAGLGAIVIPERIEVPYAGEAFDESGNLIAGVPKNILSSLSKTLIETAGRLVN